MAAVSLVIDTAVEKSTLVTGENELLINLNFTLLFWFRATPSINIPSKSCRFNSDVLLPWNGA